MRIDRVGSWCGLWCLAAALFVALTAVQRPAMGAVAGPTTRPNYDWYIIDQHHQFNAPSCIPSSVEMVLKLEHREPVDFYDLQKAWGNKTDGTFADFDGRSIGGLTFHKQFSYPRTIFFPINDLFKIPHEPQGFLAQTRPDRASPRRPDNPVSDSGMSRTSHLATMAATKG
jgi:hypothetical protein